MKKRFTVMQGNCDRFGGCDLYTTVWNNKEDQTLDEAIELMHYVSKDVDGYTKHKGGYLETMVIEEVYNEEEDIWEWENIIDCVKYEY